MLFGTDARFAQPFCTSRSHTRRINATCLRVLALGVFVCTILCASPTVPTASVNAEDPEPSNLPPEIIEFGGAADPLGWTFEGQVIDEDPLGMVVTFGGLLSGHQATVNDADGYFYYSAEISGTGGVTAETVDDEQQSSNTAYCPVY